MTSKIHRPVLEEVLDEFFFSTDTPSADNVLRACEAYPDFREDILEFAALWSSYDSCPEPNSDSMEHSVTEESVSRLQSFVLNRLHDLDHRSTTSGDLEGAKKAISTLAGAALRRASVACALGESTLLLQKVLTNSIVDVPSRVLSALAAHLNLTLSALQQALVCRPTVGRSYSASIKPNAPGRETWESAVKLLSTSEEERSRLLALNGKVESR